MRKSRWAAIAALSGLSLFSLGRGGGVPGHSPSPFDVGAKDQLFIDHRFIESSENVQLMVHPPTLPEGEVLSLNSPWEEGGGEFAAVFEDEGIYKMWYESEGWDATTKTRRGKFVSYLVSRDGLHWEKPSLGVIEHGSSKNNNIVMAGITQGSAFIDPVAKPGERYKYIGYMRPDPHWPESQGTEGLMYVCTSGDGIHWKRGAQPVFPLYCDMLNQAFWDARIQKYVVYLRSWNPMRTVSRAEVEDLTKPWPYDTAVKLFYKWGEKWPAAVTTQLPVVFGADERDPVVSDYYQMAASVYPYAQNVYVGFPSAYLHYDGPAIGAPPEVSNPLQKLAEERQNDGALDIQLVVSRDGSNWTRPERRPFIGLGSAGSGGGASLYMAIGMLRRGDKLNLYYFASDTSHGGKDWSLTSGPQPTMWENFRKRSLRRAVVPLHRLISATSAWDGGSLTTPPVVFSGSKLELNINTSAMGVARVEMLDGAGNKMEGFSLQDCDPINGNYMDHVVSWNGKSDLSSLKGKPVRLRIVSRSTDLYAFRFAP